MPLALKYRIIALTLAGVFAMFSIGLPVVVASCPMMEMTRGIACCAIDDDATPGVARFTNAIDSSCCQTTYASDRNKTEFLQEQLKRVETLKFIIASIRNDVAQSVMRNPQSAIPTDTSPPRSVDIPIFVSSLLI